MKAVARAGRGPVAVLALGVLLVLAGCTGDRPVGDPTPAPLPPREERLEFVWTEHLAVPPEAREVVDFARDWLYAYYLWNTDPRPFPPFLDRHTTEPLLSHIRGASGPPTAGAIRITLLEVDLDGAAATAGMCLDLRDNRILDEHGDPRRDTRGGAGASRLGLVRSGGGLWMVEDNFVSIDKELGQRCEEVLQPHSPFPSIMGFDGVPR